MERDVHLTILHRDWRPRTTDRTNQPSHWRSPQGLGATIAPSGVHTQSLIATIRTCRKLLRPAAAFLERSLQVRLPDALDLIPVARCSTNASGVSRSQQQNSAQRFDSQSAGFVLNCKSGSYRNPFMKSDSQHQTNGFNCMEPARG